jgi:amidohydrolase
VDWTERVDDELLARLTEWRRHLHANPELSFQEHQTTDFICELLAGWNIPHERPLETGVVAHIKGSRPGPTVAVRCDIDALPIDEENHFEFVSKRPGVMHACGHDGHTAILLGVAKVLAEVSSEIQGEVRLLFQPAEEVVASGAKHFIAAGVVRDVDAIVGLHLMSGVDVGKISLREGPVMASTDRFEIAIDGSGGHGAFPHQTVDPIVIAASLVGELQTVVSRRVDPLQPAVLSLGSIHGGDAFNVIPQRVELEGTTRALSEPVRDLLEAEILRICEHHAAAHGARAEVVYERGSPSLDNNAALVEHLIPAAAAVVGRENVVRVPPIMGGEDFAHYSRLLPSAFAFVGSRNREAGSDFPHHHPRFTIDESALGIGLRYSLEAVERLASVGGGIPQNL